MGAHTTVEREAIVEVDNVGGIDHTEVTFSPGITVLAGRNATNRTSFLRAIMAALGSDDVSIKGDADEARVELTLDDETYTRTLRRDETGATTGGDPYLEDTTLADLFAFLLEANEARLAIGRSDDLREIIMRPIDTEIIQARIDRLDAERRDVTEELEDLEDLADRVPELEARLADLDEEVETTRSALEETEAKIERADGDLDESRAEESKLETKLDELREVRSTVEELYRDIDAERRSIDALHEELDDLETEAEDLPDPVDEDDDLDAELVRLRERIQTLNSTVSELQTIIRFDEDMLEGTSSEIAAVLRGDDAPVTDRLVEHEIVCWTCGSEVEYERIEGTLDRLRDLRQEKLSRRNELRDEIANLESRRDTIQERRRRREQVHDRIDRIESELERREAALETLRERREERQSAINRLEAEVEALRSTDQSTVLNLHREANQLEFELGRLEQQRERTADELATVEDRLAERDDLEARRDEIDEEFDDLRTRVDRIEREAVGQFNEHMDAIVDVLDYANLDRVWLEPVEREVREGRRTVIEPTFDLHVVRSTAAGTVYEDSIDHLSESEREVVGLVFALAGYLVHEVYGVVPFVLLDSLEALDSERIATLVEYLGDYAEYLVVALLEEDAAALSDEYERVTDI